jgi:signal transduction histidine kinase
MPQFKSIMWRIIFLHVIAVVVTAIFMPLALYWFVNAAANSLHHDLMREQAELVARHLQSDSDGRWTLDLPRDLRDLYSEAYGRYAYAVLDDSGHVLFSSRKDQTPVFPADPLSSGVEVFETGRGGKMISGVSVRKEIGGQSVWVQTAEDLLHRDELIDDIVADFFQRVGWITLPILLLLLVTDVAIFRRAVRPLLHASQMAQNINPVRIDVRLPIDDIPSEILPLVAAVNQALDRLEQGFRLQREFTADAAHELRTPLAILRTRIDTLTDRQVSQALLRDIEGMSRIVSQLLDIAELDTIIIDPSEKADLRHVCAEVAEFLAPLALRQKRDIALSGANEPIWVKGSEQMLHRAIRNLVENAITHTPEGTTVEIAVGQNGTVDVRDQGQGIPAAERELIFRRFWRRDRHRAGGAGLGLSIVRRTVEAYGATIRVDNSPAGGAQFSLSFARAD